MIVLASIALFAYLAVSSLRSKSATFDEVAYLPAGYTHIALGDYRMLPEHPTLVKAFAALPLIFMDARMHVDPSDRYWSIPRAYEWGRQFLYLWNDADRLLTAGRLMIVGLTSLLILSVFFWTCQRFGLLTASLAALFCALSPDILAHGRLITTDVAITLLYFICMAQTLRLTERLTPARVLALGVSLGTAFAVKFSAIALVPILGGLATIVVWKSAPWPLCYGFCRGEVALVSRSRRLITFVLTIIIVGVVSIAVLWAAYGFQFEISPDREWRAQLDWSEERPASTLAANLLQDARNAHLLPEGFLYGFAKFLKHSQSRPAFLAGRRSRTGWWYFFPMTLMLKTPVPLLLLLPLGAWLSFRERRWPLDLFLWIPPLVYLTLAMIGHLNIGHRHLLPLAPFMFIACARGASWGLSRSPRAIRAAIALLLFWYAAGTLRIHPHYLAYFNEIGGGPSNGYNLLVDSNLDWGQDLPALRDFMRENHIPSVKFSYFGIADPKYYGIPCERLPGLPIPRPRTKHISRGDWIAISATHLQGLYVDDHMGRLAARLRRLEPVAQVGYSIMLYRAEFDWDLP